MAKKETKKIEEQPIEEAKEEVKEEVKVEEKKASHKPKKVVIVIFIIFMGLLFCGIGGVVIFNFITGGSEPKPIVTETPLPKPEVDPARGDFGVDKNINIDTIDKYLGRKDTVYRDMRMLEDPATYENIGGDRYLSGYIKGFEVIPLPYIIPVDGLPVEVGQTYDGITLFYLQDNKYIANYEESMEILEKYFPKDKNIFLMCGGGGYAAMMKNFLIAMGWDENKIYNIGGYWYYQGENKVDLKRDNGSLDFDNVPYIEIDFNSLTKAPEYKDAGVKVQSINLYSKELEVEERMTVPASFYILPNNASNKEVKWSSSDEKIATVSDTGVIKGIKEGTATITVTTIDRGKTDTLTVTVKKRIENKIVPDDVSKEKKEINDVDLVGIYNKYNNIAYNENGELVYPYTDTYKYTELMAQRDNEYKVAFNKRASIINSLMDNNKSFFIIVHRDTCGDRPYNVAERGPAILDEYGYTYIEIKEDYYTRDGNNMFSYTYLDNKKISGGSLLVIKNGELIDSLDTDIVNIGNEEDFKTFLSKYVDLK